MAEDFGWRSRFDADGCRRLDLFSPDNSENRQRQIALEDQRPERSGKRGIVIRTCDRQARGGSQTSTRKSRDATARELPRKVAGAGYAHRRTPPPGRLESLQSPTTLPFARH